MKELDPINDLCHGRPNSESRFDWDEPKRHRNDRGNWKRQRPEDEDWDDWLNADHLTEDERVERECLRAEHDADIWDKIYPEKFYSRRSERFSINPNDELGSKDKRKFLGLLIQVGLTDKQLCCAWHNLIKGESARQIARGQRVNESVVRRQLERTRKKIRKFTMTQAAKGLKPFLFILSDT